MSTQRNDVAAVQAGRELPADRTPVGVWTGTVTHDDQTDEFTISFTADGGVTLLTPVSSGSGTWTPTDTGYRYTIKESFHPGVGLPGYVTVNVDAERIGTTYKGSGPCTIHRPDGEVVHTTFAEVTAEQQSPEGRDLLAGPGRPAPLDVAKAALIAAAQAADADTGRRVQPGVIEALDAAGFPAWFTPERWGGSPRGYAELTRSVVTLGRACPSSAWLASLFAFATRYVACLPEQAQAEVWAEGPGARVAAVVKPLGQATPADGGWRLSGSWTYVSGVEYADWALLAGPAPAGPPSAGGTPPLFFLVPRQDFSYEDTWHPLGMRGTGSHTLTVDDVFVPAHRTCLREDAMKGRPAGVPAGPPAAPPVPTLAVNGLTFVAPALGAALGALAAAAPGISRTPTGPREASGQAYQVAYARAAGEIDAAQLLLERIAETADSGRLDPALVRRSRRDASLALEMLTGAVDALLRTGGTRAQEEGQPLQRFWRDVRSVASHAVVQFEPAALDYTRGLAA
ncbi:acyl-CoA dehydrogenase family protein [Streptomyces sp. NPDC007369]|uniref:acyl-CoA dehydrogenase family protein n=1 Tax=Streptomyces sp. NPDC007369 TaxID=3154589 RepID=UPI0033EC467B